MPVPWYGTASIQPASCYYTVKVCSLSELSSVVVESGIRCPCMINTCHATALGILYPVYRLAALAGLQPSLLQYHAWVLVSLEIQYHPAPSYPAAAASRRHKFSAIIFGRLDSPFQMAFLDLRPTLHMHPRLRISTMLQHPDSPERVSTIELSTRFAILAERLLPRPMVFATAVPQCCICRSGLRLVLEHRPGAYNTTEYGVLNRKQSRKTLN